MTGYQVNNKEGKKTNYTNKLYRSEVCELSGFDLGKIKVVEEVVSMNPPFRKRFSYEKAKHENLHNPSQNKSNLVENVRLLPRRASCKWYMLSLFVQFPLCVRSKDKYQTIILIKFRISASELGGFTLGRQLTSII